MGTFTVDLTRFTNERKEMIEDKIRSFVYNVSVRLVERSPVGQPGTWKVKKGFKGYVPGQFKANWQYGFGLMGSSSLTMVDPTGKVSTARVAAGVKSQDDVYGIHYLYNNLPYAMLLETGYSKQAPAGIVGLTMIEFEGSWK